MKLGSRMTEESRAKMSIARKGKPLSPETCAKMSRAKMGHLVSLETREKISIANFNPSTEKRTKLSAAHRGVRRPLSLATKAKISAALWKGGPQVKWAKSHARRRTLGFVSLNEPFIGCEAHHVDNEQVIFMPKELHRSIFHRQTDGRGMAKINAIAYNFLFKQEVKSALEMKK